MALPTLADVKARLNKTTTADDAELQSMLDAALAEYSARVAPLTTSTYRYDSGREVILPRGATVTAVAYTDGTAVPLADLHHNPNSGVLRFHLYRTSTETEMWWGGAPAVDVTFTTTLPAHHREAILADVAGLFAATQRGNSPGALPGSGYESALEDRTTPVTLFPRIKALAAEFATAG